MKRFSLSRTVVDKLDDDRPVYNYTIVLDDKTVIVSQEELDAIFDLIYNVSYTGENIQNDGIVEVC